MNTIQIGFSSHTNGWQARRRIGRTSAIETLTGTHPTPEGVAEVLARMVAVGMLPLTSSWHTVQTY